MKDLMNGHYAAYRAMLREVFDPNLSQWWLAELSHKMMPNTIANSPWILGVFTDDSDYFWDSGVGTDSPTSPAGHSTTNIGYMDHNLPHPRLAGLG